MKRGIAGLATTLSVSGGLVLAGSGAGTAQAYGRPYCPGDPPNWAPGGPPNTSFVHWDWGVCHNYPDGPTGVVDEDTGFVWLYPTGPIPPAGPPKPMGHRRPAALRGPQSSAARHSAAASKTSPTEYCLLPSEYRLLELVDGVVATFQTQPTQLQQHGTRRGMDEVVSQRDLHDRPRALGDGDQSRRIGA